MTEPFGSPTGPRNTGHGFDSSGLGGMIPSVGRIVHYVPYGTPVREDGTQAFPSGPCRAAMITEVGYADEAEDDKVVGLVVFNPTGLFFHPLVQGGCAYDGRQEPGTWHWPERV